MNNPNYLAKKQLKDAFNKMPKKHQTILIFAITGILTLTIPQFISFILGFIFPFMKGTVVDIAINIGLMIWIVLTGMKKAIKIERNK